MLPGRLSPAAGERSSDETPDHDSRRGRAISRAKAEP